MCKRHQFRSAGSAELAPVFDQTSFHLSALTNPNFLLDAGIVIGAPSTMPVARLQ